MLEGLTEKKEEEAENILFVHPLSTGIDTQRKCDISRPAGGSIAVGRFDPAIDATAVPSGDRTDPDTEVE
jgi:hypothetical protein